MPKRIIVKAPLPKVIPDPPPLPDPPPPEKVTKIEVGVKGYNVSVSAEQFTGISLDLLLFKVAQNPGAFIDFLIKGSFTVKIYEDKMVWRKS